MPTVKIKSTGEVFSLPHNAHLSDANELQLGGLVFGCRSGACGICAIEVLEGGENLSPRGESEEMFLEFLGHQQASVRLACQCRLRGDITLVQL